MLAQKRQYNTSEEYFVLETQADYKSEYHQGEIMAMAGGSLNHNRIAKNTSFAIEQNPKVSGSDFFLCFRITVYNKY